MRTYGLRFDVNCSILFTELPLLQRPARPREVPIESGEGGRDEINGPLAR